MEDFIKVGRIPKKVKEKFKLELKDGDDVFILRKTLDSFAFRWPNSYLAKISEAKRILRNPLYYANKGKKLFFVKEYLRANNFVKAAIEIDIAKQPHLTDIYTLTPKRRKDITWFLWTR